MIVAQINAITAAAKQAQAATSGLSTGSAGGGGGGGTTPSSAAAMMNANANMVRAQSQWTRAQIQAMRSSRRSSSQAPDWLKNLRTLIYSTRIGFGGGGGPSVMPLVGTLFKMLGSLPPVIQVVVDLLLLLTAALTAAIASAIQYGTNFAKAYFIGGGTASQTAALSGIGGAAGISATQMAQMAQQYNQYLMSNPYAGARAAAGGYSANYAGPYGDQNDTRRFLKGLQDILNPKTTDRQAIAAARGGPLEGFLWMRKADEGLRQFAFNLASIQSSEANQKEAANAQLQWNVALQQGTILMVQLGNLILPAVNAQLTIWLDLIRLARMGFDELVIGMYLFLKWLHDVAHVGPGSDKPQEAYADLERLKAHQSAKNTDAIDRLTDATNQNIRALNNQRQVYGGGENAANALPQKYFQPNNYGYSRSQIALGQIPI